MNEYLTMQYRMEVVEEQYEGAMFVRLCWEYIIKNKSALPSPMVRFRCYNQDRLKMLIDRQNVNIRIMRFWKMDRRIINMAKLRKTLPKDRMKQMTKICQMNTKNKHTLMLEIPLR